MTLLHNQRWRRFRERRQISASRQRAAFEAVKYLLRRVMASTTPTIWDQVPAWAQAIAAVIALVLSVVAIRRQSNAEQRRQELQAHGIAVAIYPELVRLGTELDEARKLLDRPAPQPEPGPNYYGGQGLKPIPLIQIPLILERNIEQFYVLGEPTGRTLSKLMSDLMTYQRLIGKITQTARSLEFQAASGFSENEAKEVECLFKEMKQMIDRAIADINRLLCLEH